MAAVDYFGGGPLDFGRDAVICLCSWGRCGVSGGHLVLILQKPDVSGWVLCRTWAGHLRAGQKACQDHLHEDPLFGVLAIPVLFLHRVMPDASEGSFLSCWAFTTIQSSCWRPFKDTSLQPGIQRCLSSMERGNRSLINSCSCWCQDWGKCWDHHFPMWFSYC